MAENHRREGQKLKLVCVICGKEFELPLEALPVSPEEVSDKQGFETVKSRVEYRGYCVNCRKSQNK